MPTIDPEAPNVLHAVSHRAHWSRANEKGVFPGVSTPLNWSIWGEIGERAVRLGAYDVGLLDEHELDPPASVDDRGWSIFYGRPSANVDTWRGLYERGLGNAGQGAATQRQVFGDAGANGVASSPASEQAGAISGVDSPSGTPDDPLRRRTIIESRRPVALATSPARLRATRREAIAWWREATRALVDAREEIALRVFRDAIGLFERADRDHIVVSLLSTEAVTALANAAASAGRPEAANAMMIGYPGMEEFETAVAVWDLSRGKISLAAFLEEHGFHGAMEGEIASRSWREASAPVEGMAARHAKLEEAADPRARETRAVAERERLEAALRSSVSPAARVELDRAIALAATCLPMREAGRATLTIALDAMRAAARRIGVLWAAAGRIDAVEDVFQLTRFELVEPPDGLRALVAERRALAAGYARFELPETWHGMPGKIPTSRLDGGLAHAGSEREKGRDGIGSRAPGSAPLAVGDRIAGLGASSGLHAGIARVVVDPADPALEFEAGDVLVAPATDPSWAPLFLVAGAVVIDTGSNISHAAVVAREMGIPAVVAARDASRRLRTGQRLRVDGKAGIVEVIDDGA